MTWPTDDLSTAHFDQGTDSPAKARGVLYTLIQRVKSMIAGRGKASGVCELDAAAKVPPTRIRRGEAGGVCELDNAGVIPTTRLPASAATAAGSGLIRSGNTLSHADTSSAAKVNNHLVTGISLDDYGHVTSIQKYTDLPVRYSEWSWWQADPWETTLNYSKQYGGSRYFMGLPKSMNGYFLITGISVQSRNRAQEVSTYRSEIQRQQISGHLSIVQVKVHDTTVNVTEKRFRYRYISLPS